MENNLTIDEILTLQAAIIEQRKYAGPKLETKLKDIFEKELKLLHKTPFKVEDKDINTSYASSINLVNEITSGIDSSDKLLNNLKNISLKQQEFENKIMETEKLKKKLEDQKNCEIYKKIKQAQKIFSKKNILL